MCEDTVCVFPMRLLSNRKNISVSMSEDANFYISFSFIKDDLDCRFYQETRFLDT